MYIQQQQLKSSKYCEKINVDETHAYDFAAEKIHIQLNMKQKSVRPEKMRGYNVSTSNEI